MNRSKLSLLLVIGTALLALLLPSCRSRGGGGNSGPVRDNNALLSSIALSAGTLSPVFSSATRTYTSDVTVLTIATGVTVSTGSAKATLTINGIAAASGVTRTVGLFVGQTDIEIVVIAEDGTSTKTYTITAARPGIGINPASVDVEALHTATLNVALASASVSDTTITLSSSNTGAVTVPASVIVPALATYAAFTATSISAGPTAVTITATLNSDTATATVNVLSALCGNALIDLNEQCDDGGAGPGDGCSTVCQLETGWICAGIPSVCSSVCADGIVAGAEQCDAGLGNGSTTCGCQNGCSYAASSTSCAPATDCTEEMFCDSFGSCPPVTNKADATACSLPNASSTCVSGICGGSTVLTCTPGFGDCDGDLSNGCEMDTLADVSNCGSCGIMCSAGESCVAGVCITPPCTSDVDCTGLGERCDAGVCTVPACATAADCPGTDTACQQRICSAGTCGVFYPSSACDDGNACTVGDTCSAGVCTGTSSCL